MKRILLTFLLISTQLIGCAWSPGLYLGDGDFETDKLVEEEPMPVTLIRITPSLIEKQSRKLQASLREKRAMPDVTEYEYQVGPQDVLNIIVWDHPELTIPTGGRRPAEEDGHRVSSKGAIFYPFIGLVNVAGKTTEQIRVILTKRLSGYIRKPQLDVRVVGFHSQKVQVAGAVEKPGSYPITGVALMLSDAVNLAGRDNERADIQSVILTRNGVNTFYNLIDRYYRGDASQDIVLQDEDIVYVPANNVHKVFVMGEVEKQAALPLIDGRLSLADALASSGVDQFSADNERIFVLRMGDDISKPYAYHLDASEPGALILATSFQLQPLDVVFVSTADAARLGRVMQQLLPSVNSLLLLDRVTE